MSVNPRAEATPKEGFVSFVGESAHAEHDDLNTPPDYCHRHNRGFTYREMQAGRCCWCHPEDRPEWQGKPDILDALAKINAMADGITDETDETRSCLDCGVRLDAGRRYRCPACVEAARARTVVRGRSLQAMPGRRP